MKRSVVLIVDDSSVMRKIIEQCLRKAGVEMEAPLEASNGVEALSIVRQKKKLDLILLDINMPAMDGIEFLRQLRQTENGNSIPVVMVTTEGTEDHVSEAMAYGARAYIRKPFTPDQVSELVAPILEE